MSAIRGEKKLSGNSRVRKKSGAAGVPAPRRKKAAGRKRRSPRWGLRICVAVLVFVVAVFGWAVLARKWAPVSNTDQSHYDALVVLGDKADADGNPTPVLLARVQEAVREYERGVAPHIILTGGAAHSPAVEAEVMARVARAEGVPQSSIILEDKALDTIQNLCYSTRILREHGWNSAEIISSSTHLPRAAMIAQGYPLAWSTHAAPPLTPPSATRYRLAETMEQIKTVRFLLWARLNERCQP